MVDAVHQQLVDDLFLFVNKNLNLTVAGMKRDWPGSHEISHTDAKTSLLLVNEEKKMRIVPMDKHVFGCLALGIKTGGDFIMAECGKNLAQNYDTDGSPPATQCCRKIKDIAFLCFTNLVCLIGTLI